MVSEGVKGVGMEVGEDAQSAHHGLNQFAASTTLPLIDSEKGHRYNGNGESPQGDRQPAHARNGIEMIEATSGDNPGSATFAIRMEPSRRILKRCNEAVDGGNAPHDLEF